MAIRRSITRRWMINTLGVILLLLILVNIVFATVIRNYFYSNAESMITSGANTNKHLIMLYSEDSSKNITAEIRNLVENYTDKDKIELVAINFNGDVVHTSSGFPVKETDEIPDYVEALNSADGNAYHVGKLDTGEKYMSYTVLVDVVNSEYSALRYMVSLKNIDTTIFNLILIVAGISVVIVIFVVLSGSFFINSIVLPIREIGEAVRQIAAGDMQVRIYHPSKDELGELCETINYMADELSNSEKLKNEFISSVSHELRTPLTAIQGWSETITSLGLADISTMQKGMGVIINETERLSGMVEELLDFSRIQEGRFSLLKDKMDILAELEEAVLMYTERAKRDGKLLNYKELEMLPFIYGDKNRIRQVFINVIDNALKYTDPGQEVRVWAEVWDGMIIIVVEDNGCGIEPEDLPRVKEKFYKANNTRRGSGIGLAVATEIVEMHGGNLDITSQRNVGTKVMITLPADNSDGEITSEEFEN